MASEHTWLDERPPRLGDLIDDHCPRCKRLMNHAIASFMGNKVVKVVCQTCHSEHPFFEGKEKKKKPKASAFDQVLAKVDTPSDSAKESPAKKAKPKSGHRPLIRHKAKPSGKK
jgi:ribosomal protein L31